MKHQLGCPMRDLTAIAYPPIGQHGVIGDRRSAALVATDGTIDWLCLPHYGADVVFGAILDHERGGLWRLGPAASLSGTQSYRDETFTLLTTWADPEFELELADMMGPPLGSVGEQESGRFLIRRLRCLRGRAPCSMCFSPRRNFEPVPINWTSPAQASARTDKWQIGLWCSRPVWESDERAAQFELGSGDEIWTVLALEPWPHQMSVQNAAERMQRSDSYWRQWVREIDSRGRPGVRRSAALIHLLSYGPAGSIVAAPTTSLPERIGSDWNADYRLSWVRDTSLALGILADLDKTKDGTHYLDWLMGLGSSTRAPLQVVYGVQGETELTPHERTDLFGYRHSQPVRFGNHAYKQQQHDSLGYLADCILRHLELGGEWRPEFWTLVRRVADFVTATWKHAGNSIWELPVVQHYLSGKIMSWVALDRRSKLQTRSAKGPTSRAGERPAVRSTPIF